MIRQFKIDIYECNVAFANSCSKEEIIKYLKEQGADEEQIEETLIEYDDPITGAFTLQISDLNYMIVFKEQTKHKEVAHEVLHLVWMLMEKLKIHDQEAWAYLNGYIVEKYYEF